MWRVEHASTGGREAMLMGSFSLLHTHSGLETGPTSWAVHVSVLDGKVKSWHWFEDSELFARTFRGTTTQEEIQMSTNRDIVTTALRKVFAEGDVASVDEYFGPEYIQHNPEVEGGVKAFKGLVGALAENPDFRAETFRVLADGDLVATHSIYYGFAEVPLVAFDVFRLADGRIVEHWDNMIPVAEPNPSRRTQTDGATKITDHERTAENKARVAEFVERAFIRQEEINLADYISAETYLQHNPAVADGLAGLGAFLQQMAEQGLTMEYTKLHKVVGEGNFVLALSEGSFGGKATAFYDLFRLQDGLIVEHWDVIADMPSEDAAHNEDGKF